MDAGGPAALTVRALAREAGTSPMAVYTYASDLDDLANLVGDAFLGLLDLRALSVREPVPDARARLAGFVEQVADLFDRHPGRAHLLATRPIVGPNAFALNEALLAFLTHQGFSVDRAADAVYGLTAFLHGHVVLSSTDAYPASAMARFPDLPSASEHPLTRAVRGTGGHALPGINVWLDGLGLDRPDAADADRGHQQP